MGSSVGGGGRSSMLVYYLCVRVYVYIRARRNPRENWASLARARCAALNEYIKYSREREMLRVRNCQRCVCAGLLEERTAAAAGAATAILHTCGYGRDYIYLLPSVRTANFGSSALEGCVCVCVWTINWVVEMKFDLFMFKVRLLISPLTFLCLHATIS